MSRIKILLKYHLLILTSFDSLQTQIETIKCAKSVIVNHVNQLGNKLRTVKGRKGYLRHFKTASFN